MILPAPANEPQQQMQQDGNGTYSYSCRYGHHGPSVLLLCLPLVSFPVFCFSARDLGISTSYQQKHRSGSVCSPFSFHAAQNFRKRRDSQSRRFEASHSHQPTDAAATAAVSNVSASFQNAVLISGSQPLYFVTTQEFRHSIPCVQQYSKQFFSICVTFPSAIR